MEPPEPADAERLLLTQAVGRAARRPRGWRFSLRTGFILLATFAMALAWVVRPWLAVRQAAAERAMLSAHGAWVSPNDEDDDAWFPRGGSEKFEVLRWDSYQTSDAIVPLVLRHPELQYFKTFAESIRNNCYRPIPYEGLTDAGVEQLATMPNLVSLSIHGRGVTDACLPALRRMPKLTSLFLANTSVTREALDRWFPAGGDVSPFLFDADPDEYRPEIEHERLW